MPHVCGDEPQNAASDRNMQEVCPTYVGMNRPALRRVNGPTCMPHVCGDEPYKRAKKPIPEEYAPRMWG